MIATLKMALVAALAAAAFAAGSAYAADPPQFKLGFKALADQIPEIVGQPLENERYAANGDSLQPTTTGLMVWRKADNWTAFTDGHTTWLNGPNGLQSRLNSQRLAWEQPASSLTLEMLRDAEYQSEFAPGRKATLKDGAYSESIAPGSATKVTIRLADQHAFGDLNGDGAADAAGVLVTDPGGSGTFYHLVALLDQDGRPRHAASALLGDRIAVKSLSIQSGEIVVDLLIRGPQQPMSTPPAFPATRTYHLEGNELKLGVEIEGPSTP